jgi:hypothetical protein
MVCILGAAVSGCVNAPVVANGGAHSQLQLPSALFAKLGGENLKDETLQRALAGIRHLEQGKHAAASHEFNAALQLDPSRSYLQMLNGLAYHLQAVAGDADKFDLAEQGSIATRKGTNLLSSLSLQFGSDDMPAYQRTRDVEVNDGANAITTTLKRAITIPALTYSLNIANANTDINEILARPTLAALEGVKSDFFSGTELNAAVVASSNNNVGGSVLIEKEIGVRLGITPFFVEGGRVKLEVEAERTFLKPPSNDVSFDYKIETSKTTVNARAIASKCECHCCEPQK